MPEVIPTFSVWLYLANICFLLAAMARDLFVLRCCLLLAYVNLLINSCMGLPHYGTIYNPFGPISIDGIVSCIVIGFIHVYAIWRLWMDDVDIKLEDEWEPLWRLFYRRTGVLKLEFKAMVHGCRIVSYKAGDIIATSLDHKVNAYFILNGVVTNCCGACVERQRRLGSTANNTTTATTSVVAPAPVEGLDEQEQEHEHVVASSVYQSAIADAESELDSESELESQSETAGSDTVGDDGVKSCNTKHNPTPRYSGMFIAVHLFSVFCVWLSEGEEFKDLHSVAQTDCRVLVFPCAALEAMAHRPPLVAAWKNLLLFGMAQARCSVPQAKCGRGHYFYSTGRREPESFYHGAPSLDFMEFTPDELEASGIGTGTGGGMIWMRLFVWVRRTFNPFLASGLRHGSPVPLHGAEFRRRIAENARRLQQAQQRWLKIQEREARQANAKYAEKTVELAHAQVPAGAQEQIEPDIESNAH